MFILLLAALAHSLTFEIDAHKSQCYFEDMKRLDKATVTFQVQAGGFLDIDIEISSPDGRVIHTGERETEGKYSFVADVDGAFKVCFSNKMSTVTAKTVSFTFVTGDGAATHSGVDEDDLSPLEMSILQLSDGLASVQSEQKYMRARERVHRNTSESTNARVLWWSIFEAFVLVAMSLWQLWNLHRFFEVKRAV